MKNTEEIYLEISKAKNEELSIIDQIINIVKLDYPNSKFCRATINSKVTLKLNLNTIKLTKTVEDLCATNFGSECTKEQFDLLMKREKILFKAKEIIKIIKNCKRYNKKKTA